MNNDFDKKLIKSDFNSNAGLIEIFNNSPDLIFIHDKIGTLIEINENMRKILGYRSTKRDIGNLLRTIVILDGKKNDESIYQEFFKNLIKKSKRLEYIIKSKKGNILYVQGYSIPIPNNRSNSPLFLHIAHDIGEEKKIQKELNDTQKELKSLSAMIPEVRLWSLSQKKNSLNLIQKSGQVLKESEEKYRIILENIQEGYLEIDLNGYLVFFNKALCDIVGFSEEELIGVHYTKLMDDSTSKLIKYTLDNFLPKRDIQLQLLKKNNKKVYAETSLTEKFNSKGEKIGWFGVLRDISERKKSENLESKFRVKLENEVKIRTQELHEVLDSQKLYMTEILKASNFKTIFLSTMSHELRTPLNAIIGFSDILIEESYGTLIDEQKDFLNDIRVSAEDLLEMINKILDLSKIEAGELELKLKKVKLKKIIDQTLSIIEPIYAKKNLEFELKGINEEIEFIADPTRLKEILFNLLSNAIKFTPKGKVCLEIFENNSEWIFNIIDTGIGIAEKDFDIIFKEFKRVESDFVSSVSGSGLGLALTKRLINLHDGKIFFQSILGQGTTFTFTIPKNLKKRD
ncbi:MAG: PAS domain S-box protein [Candidatus Lokiarchaeia archaeon]